MYSDRSKPGGISLRVRVAFWIAGAVLVTSVLILAVVREGVRQALVHELDETLQADADEILLERAQHLAEPERVQETMRNQARAHHDGIWYAQLLGNDGRNIFSTPTTPTAMPRGVPQSNKPESVGGYRVLQKPTSDGQAVLRVGMLLSVIDNDMARIDRLVSMVALGFLLVAPIAGFVLATVILRPITEMSERTALLHPHRLDGRLPLSGAGHELDHLATVINKLLGRIAQYVGEHRGLMADAAHQLRTPLAAIRSSVEVITSAAENSEENQELLAKVLEQIESLETLVNQLLLLAETEVENLNLGTERVRLDEIVRRSLEMFDAVAESLGVQLEIGTIDHAEVRGNRHYLRQVVNNLIDNALKFTAIKEGPRRVAIHLRRLEYEGTVQLQIIDSGIGIKAEHLSHIFARFYRIDQVRHVEIGVRGNGLGLSIVKSVVESHGGEVDVQSTEGQGTTFTVQLPLVQAEAAATG
jgi:two-component system, OmpR family, heavy metal sensor histidine kinase CusS